MNTELDPEDLKLLQNIGDFNAKYAASGWHIREKDVRGDLSRMRLLNSSMASVRVLGVQWNAAVVTNTKFMSVEFTQAKFSGATLQDVVFTDCTFSMCSLQRARLTNCRFVNCRSEELNAGQAVFLGCSFDAFKDFTGVFTGATFRSSIFERCEFKNSSFRSAQLDSLPVRHSVLHNVVFGDLKGTDLKFEESKVEQTGFSDSHFGSIAFERGSTRGVTFKAFHADSLRIQNCEKIEALGAHDSEVKRIAITDCPAVSELGLRQCRVSELFAERCQIAFLQLAETRVLASGKFSQCQLAGMNLAGSTLVGLRLENCLIADYLVLENASFERLALSGLEYGSPLKASTSGVKYLGDSARFETR